MTAASASVVATESGLRHVLVGLSIVDALDDYSNGVLDLSTCSASDEFLPLLLIGYGTDDNSTPYWILRNSYGTVFGENGYLRVSRAMGECHFAPDARVARVQLLE